MSLSKKLKSWLTRRLFAKQRKRRFVLQLLRQRRSNIFESLEARMLLASMIAESSKRVDIFDIAAGTLSAKSSSPVAVSFADAIVVNGNHSNDTAIASHTVVFVDAGIDDFQSLLDGLAIRNELAPETQVFVLDARRDGIDQISAVRRDQLDVAAIHILSHGSSGSLQLGNSFLDRDNLQQHAEQLRGWRDSLTADADILLYGCDVAAGPWGTGFVEDFAILTGADIAASNDPTGFATLGGDWQLEGRTGVIESSVLSLDFGKLLATVTVDGATGKDTFVIAAATATKQGSAPKPFTATDALVVNGLGDKDTFTLSAAPNAASITLNGGDAEDTADLSGVAGNATIKLNNATGSVNVVVGGKTILMTGMEVVKAAPTGNHTLDLTAFAASTSLMIKVIGVNKVEVAQLNNTTWSKIFESWNVGSVKGGQGQNVFVIGKGGKLDGTIDGTSANPNNILSYSGTFTVNIIQYESGLANYGNAVLISLKAGSHTDGQASAIKNGLADGFKNIRHFIGGDGGDFLTASATASAGIGTELIGGKGTDTLTSGGESDKLTGGLGNDVYTYRAAADWVGDTLTELDNEGVDRLDLSAITSEVTVELHPFVAPGTGLKISSPSVADLNNLKYIEQIDGGAAKTTYKFFDNWGQVTTTQTKKTVSFKIDDTANNIQPAANQGTLDFSNVTYDLSFDLGSDGKVEVNATNKVGNTTYAYNVSAKGIANIYGGRGKNTYYVLDSDALPGQIFDSTIAAGTAILDYSRYNGSKAVVVDTNAKSATGIYTSAVTLAAQKEVQQLTLSNVASGSFALMLQDLPTGPIQWDTRPWVTASNIEAVLNAFQQQDAFSVVADGNIWNITFNVRTDHPQMTVDVSGLTALQNTQVTGQIVTTQQGKSGDAANAIARIDQVIGDQDGAKEMVLVGPLSGILPSDAGNSHDIVYADGGVTYVQGGSGNDLMIGASGSGSFAQPKSPCRNPL